MKGVSPVKSSSVSRSAYSQVKKQNTAQELMKKKQSQLMRSSSCASPSPAKSNISYKASEFARTRLLQEFELVFKEYVKACEIANNRDSLPYQRLQHHDPQKWKKKFKTLFDREKIIHFGPQHQTQIDLRKLEFSAEKHVVRSKKQLGGEILSMAKFWILFLTLAKKESKILHNGLSDLAQYGLEDSYDNRILLADFLPEGMDQEE